MELFGSGVLHRRRFLSLVPGIVVAVHGLVRARPASARGMMTEHPEPRPGVDGSSVLGAADLTDAPHLVDLFDAIREIPHVVDGIRCHCGCAELEGYRSLLSCYEGAGMARFCEVCQGEGRLAVRRTAEGQSLAQIRRAIDARFGDGEAHQHSQQHQHARAHLAGAGLLLAALAAGSAAPAHAQIRASEPASVMQTIDGTEIVIEYFRPRARDRSPLFGHDGVVWEHVWTPGANWSTSIAFERPIRIEGVAVEPGAYSTWISMSEDQMLPETLILHPDPRIFHTNPPDPAEAVIEVPVVMHEAPHREMLTWEFEEVRTDGGTLALRWGDVRMPFDIAVEPTMRQVVTPEEAAPVVGSWVMGMGPPGAETEVSLVVTHGENGILHGDIEGVPEQGPAWMNQIDLILIPLGDRIFGMGEGWDGVLGEVWPDMTMEFEMVDGESRTFQIRNEEDEVVGEGERATADGSQPRNR